MLNRLVFVIALAVVLHRYRQGSAADRRSLPFSLADAPGCDDRTGRVCPLLRGTTATQRRITSRSCSDPPAPSVQCWSLTTPGSGYPIGDDLCLRPNTRPAMKSSRVFRVRAGPGFGLWRVPLTLGSTADSRATRTISHRLRIAVRGAP